MLNNLFLLPLAVIPMFAPLTAQVGDITPSAHVQVAKVPLPELSGEQWNLLRQQQGADSTPLQLEMNLSIDHGQVYDVSVRRSTGYPDVEQPLPIGSEQTGRPTRGLWEETTMSFRSMSIQQLVK